MQTCTPIFAGLVIKSPLKLQGCSVLAAQCLARDSENLAQCWDSSAFRVVGHVVELRCARGW